MSRKLKQNKQQLYFDCSLCPAYCCSVYERVSVSNRDLTRLSKYFGLSIEQTIRRHTKLHDGERVLRRSTDPIFGEACKFLDRETRRCSIYDGRPSVCRDYPDRTRCAYYDLLRFERKQQGVPGVLPLVQITFG